MSEFKDLNPLQCPLDGLNLIEASAGTGKTWNICGLYVRLLVERELTVSQILVVTFTKAATAELRDRIRQRIVEMLDALQTGDGNSSDAFVTDLIAHLRKQGRSEGQILARLKLARESFDEAAIFTIHGFCQRALGDAPFSAGQPFQLEAVEDDSEGLAQVVQDFWRRHIAYPQVELDSLEEPSDIPPKAESLPPVEPMTPMLAEYLIQCKDSPGQFAALLKAVLGQPLATHRWPDDLEEITDSDSTEIEVAFNEARGLWLSSRRLILEKLLIASAGRQLSQVTHKPKSIEQGYQEWEAWFGSMNSTGGLGLTRESKLGIFRESRLIRATTQGNQTPDHPFFKAAENLLAACEAQDKPLEYARLRLLRRLVAEVL